VKRASSIYIVNRSIPPCEYSVNPHNNTLIEDIMTDATCGAGKLTLSERLSSLNLNCIYNTIDTCILQ